MPEIKGDPTLARPETVTAYDPQREMLVDVPASQTKLLEAAGYTVGPAADLEAKVQGLPGKVASFMMGAANGGTFGQFQHLVPKSLRDVQQKVEEAHPVLHGAGEMATGAALAATMPGGAYGRVAASAAQGAGAEMARAVKYNQPISAERVLQGAGIGAFLGLAGEGVAAGIKAVVPATRNVLGKLAKAWPKEGADAPWLGAVRADAAKYAAEGDANSAQMMRDYAKETGEKAAYKRALGWEPLAATAMVSKSAAATLAAADKGITSALNNLDTIHGALDKLQVGPMKAFATTTRALIQGKAATTSVPIRDIDGEYAQKSAQVSRAAADPQGLQTWLDGTYGQVLREHPELHQQLAVRASMTASVLNEHMPKDPGDPTLQSPALNPPRSAKLEWLRHYHAVNNPLEALQNPTPGTMQTMEEIHPETVHLVRQAMLSYAMSPEGQKMTSAQARRISIIIGGPVRPQNTQGYVQRLAQTHQEAQAKSSAAQASTSGTKPGTSLDATNPMKLMMGQ
jgi:hypothetical protein